MSDNKTILIELTADIVGSFVQNNHITPDAIPSLIEAIHGALKGLEAVEAVPVVEQVKQAPAVSIKKSVQPDQLICLECGKAHKSLKRHLSTAHDLDPLSYREKWNLPSDYPMVAPTYSAARSDLAKAMGLGNKRKASSKKKAAA